MGGCVSGPFININIAKLSFINKGVIKQGGFGTVYRVRERETSEEFAVKIISTKNDESLQKKAKYEISILRKFRNLKEIVHLMSADFDDNGEYYLVFPYFPRGSLADLLADFRKYDLRLTKERIVCFLSHVVNGLIWIHTLGYIHRDLKPANFVLNDRDQLVIIDLGSVMRRNIIIGNNKERTRLIDECNEKCSILYRPPELFSCDLGSFITDKVDTWMLGCCLYEMIYTRNPMEAVHASGNSVALAALSPERFPYPKDHCVDDEVLDLTRKMLQADPSRRISLRRIREALVKMLPQTEEKDDEEDEVEEIEEETTARLLPQQNISLQRVSLKNMPEMELVLRQDLEENRLHIVPEQDEPSVDSPSSCPTAEDEQSVESFGNYVVGSEPEESEKESESPKSEEVPISSEVPEVEEIEFVETKPAPPPITPRGPVPFNPMRFFIKRAADNCRAKYRKKFRRAGRMGSVYEEPEDPTKFASTMFTFQDAASSESSTAQYIRKDLEHSYVPPRAALVAGQRYPERGQLLAKYSNPKNPQVKFSTRFFENYLYFKSNGFSIPLDSLPPSILIDEENKAHQRQIAMLKKVQEKVEAKEKKAEDFKKRQEERKKQARNNGSDESIPSSPVVESREPRPTPYHYMPFDSVSDAISSVEEQIEFIKDYEEDMAVLQQPNPPPARTFFEILKRLRTGQKRFSEPYLLIDPPPLVRPDPEVALIENIEEVPERPDSPFSVWRQCKVFDNRFTKKAAQKALRQEPFLPKHYPINREKMMFPPVPSPPLSPIRAPKKLKTNAVIAPNEKFEQLSLITSIDSNKSSSAAVEIPMQTFSKSKKSTSSQIVTEVTVESTPKSSDATISTEKTCEVEEYVVNKLGITLPTNVESLDDESSDTAWKKSKGELKYMPALHLPDTLPALCDDSDATESD